jgi:hypothetical protein
MASVYEDTNTTELPRRELTPAIAHAIDDVLLAAHTLRASLAEGHVPLDAPMSEAVRRYQGSPLFGLWLSCRAHARLLTAVTEKPDA